MLCTVIQKICKDTSRSHLKDIFAFSHMNNYTLSILVCQLSTYQEYVKIYFYFFIFKPYAKTYAEKPTDGAV